MGFLERFGERWERTGETITKLPPLPKRAERARAARPDSAPGHANAPAAEAGSSLVDELDECKRVILDLTEALEYHKASEAAFAAVLRLPGVKQSLVKAHHDDTHRNAPAADRARCAEAMVAINLAYDRLEGNEG